MSRDRIHVLRRVLRLPLEVPHSLADQANAIVDRIRALAAFRALIGQPDFLIDEVDVCAERRHLRSRAARPQPYSWRTTRSSPSVMEITALRVGTGGGQDRDSGPSVRASGYASVSCRPATEEVNMRSIVLAGFISALAVTASAQMMGVGPQTGYGGMSNLMSREVLAPAAGRGPGANGSTWRTDLWIKAIAGSTVALEFHPLDATTDAPTATAQLSVTSGVLYLPDVLKSTFNLEQAFGNILLRSSAGVSATVRVYTLSGGGAYGAAFMAMPTSMAMRGSGGMMDGDDLYQMYVLGLQPQPRARVNVMVTNSGNTPINGTVEILDADGFAPSGGTGSLPFSIRAFSSHQFGDVLSGHTSRFGDGSGMQLRVRLANGSTGMVMVLASVVDNVTNDTYTVMGSMMNSASGMMP